MLRKLLALVGIFVFFYLGAHFYLRWKNTVYDDVTKIGRLVECQPNDFRSLEITLTGEGASGELRFERVDQPEAGVPAVTQVGRWRWRMVRPVRGEADADHVRRVASTICELYDPQPQRAGEAKPDETRVGRANKIVAGFGKTATFVFTSSSGSDRSTIIAYREDNGSDRFYRIPDQLQQVASLPVEEFRNKRVMRTDADNVQRVTLSFGGKERFTLERAGADWRVSVSGKDQGEGSDEAAKFVNRISTLRSIGIEAEDFDAAACEALPARAVVRSRDILGREEVVRFEYGPKGNLVACSSLGTQKFRVHRDLVPFLDVTAAKVSAKPAR